MASSCGTEELYSETKRRCVKAGRKAVDGKCLDGYIINAKGNCVKVAGAQGKRLMKEGARAAANSPKSMPKKARTSKKQASDAKTAQDVSVPKRASTPKTPGASESGKPARKRKGAKVLALKDADAESRSDAAPPAKRKRTPTPDISSPASNESAEYYREQLRECQAEVKKYRAQEAAREERLEKLKKARAGKGKKSQPGFLDFQYGKIFDESGTVFTRRLLEVMTYLENVPDVNEDATGQDLLRYAAQSKANNWTHVFDNRDDSRRVVQMAEDLEKFPHIVDLTARIRSTNKAKKHALEADKKEFLRLNAAIKKGDTNDLYKYRQMLTEWKQGGNIRKELIFSLMTPKQRRSVREKNV